MFLFTALLTPLQLMSFTTKYVTSSTNEQQSRQRYAFFVFFISCFIVSIILSINTFESSNDYIILIKSFISSFKLSKVNPFPALTAAFPLISISNLFIAFESKLLTNSGKLSLAKEEATFVSALMPKLPCQEHKEPPN